MIKRKDALREMLAPITEQNLADQRTAKPASKASSLKAMGLSLQGLSDEADEAQKLRDQLAAGEHIVELDPELIHPSFIRDRLPESNSGELDDLCASIAERGQLIPILVRPHPELDGKYQVAFGHRRVAALRSLSKPVKAIVRRLSDEELIIAQGKENLDRRDLSFIERALFAARLEDKGFARASLMAALAIHKGNLSTMIAVVRAIPETLITSIGPAPRVGRPRWERLAQLLQSSSADWQPLIRSEQFIVLDSDARFDYVLNATTPNRISKDKQSVNGRDGSLVASVELGKGSVTLKIDEKSTSSFGAYLIDKLPALYEAFQRRRDE